MFESFINGSKRHWGSTENSDKLSIEQIQTGCLQRIADATEAMAKNFANGKRY